MLPMMASGIAARHLTEYFEELERERKLRRRVDHRKTPRRRFAFLRIRRARSEPHVACHEPAAESC